MSLPVLLQFTFDNGDMHVVHYMWQWFFSTLVLHMNLNHCKTRQSRERRRERFLAPRSPNWIQNIQSYYAWLQTTALAGLHPWSQTLTKILQSRVHTTFATFIIPLKGLNYSLLRCSSSKYSFTVLTPYSLLIIPLPSPIQNTIRYM